MKIYLFLLLILSNSLHAAIQVTDDLDNHFTFDKPITRIISLAPHSTELLFSAGAKNQIVATVSYSDFPDAAKKIPRIGSYKKVDLEKIISLQPQLIIAWNSGSSSEQLDEMKALGLKVFFSEPANFSDVAKTIRVMGQILGTTDISNKVANQYLQELNKLRLEYQNKSPVTVFYQVWQSPLITINKDHLISQVINFCGGVNIFGDLPARAPRIDIESILNIDPDTIVIGVNNERKDWEQNWNKWSSLKAVHNNHVFTINADLIVRQTPRIIQGARFMCEYLDKTRIDLKKIKQL